MKFEQSAHLIQIASRFPAFPMFLNAASAREWDFTARMGCWWYCAVVHLRENMAANVHFMRTTVSVIRYRSFIATFVSNEEAPRW